MVNHKTLKKHKVSEATLKRLSVYLHYLQKAKENGVLTISAPIIAKELNLDPTQIVKDIATTGAKGRPRIGYNIYEVIQATEEFLGLNKSNEAFLIGAGNLGSALLSYPEFKNFGLKIVAAFDSDDSKIGKSRSGINVLHFDKFDDLCKRLKVQIGVLTVPATVAQSVADEMIKGGIKAIWNLSPVNLQVPEDVIVQNTSMYANVAILLKKLQDSDKTSSSK